MENHPRSDQQDQKVIHHYVVIASTETQNIVYLSQFVAPNIAYFTSVFGMQIVRADTILRFIEQPLE